MSTKNVYRNVYSQKNSTKFYDQINKIDQMIDEKSMVSLSKDRINN